MNVGIVESRQQHASAQVDQLRGVVTIAKFVSTHCQDSAVFHDNGLMDRELRIDAHDFAIEEHQVSGLPLSLGGQAAERDGSHGSQEFTPRETHILPPLKL